MLLLQSTPKIMLMSSHLKATLRKDLILRPDRPAIMPSIPVTLGMHLTTCAKLTNHAIITTIGLTTGAQENLTPTLHTGILKGIPEKLQRRKTGLPLLVLSLPQPRHSHTNHPTHLLDDHQVFHLPDHEPLKLHLQSSIGHLEIVFGSFLIVVFIRNPRREMNTNSGDAPPVVLGKIQTQPHEAVRPQKGVFYEELRDKVVGRPVPS